MTDGDSSISRRKVLAGLLTVGGGATLGGAGTYAALSDTEIAGIGFTAGSIQLDVTAPTDTFEPAEDYEENQGQPVTHSVSWEIFNAGTLNAGDLTLSALEITIQDSGKATRSEILNHTMVENITYEEENPGWGVNNLAEMNNNLPLALVSTESDTPELPATDDVTRTLSMDVYFDYSGISGNGGFTVSMKPTFRVTQHTSDGSGGATATGGNDAETNVEAEEKTPTPTPTPEPTDTPSSS